MRQYYHLYSDGAKGAGFCESTRDYMAAMNRIAICQHTTGVTVLAFAIEDTHVHFVLHCTSDQCIRFEHLFRKLTMMFLTYSRTERHTVRLEFTAAEIEPESDQTLEDVLRKEIAYCIIQPTKDGKPVMPYDYLWGTGSMYFRSKVIPPIWRINKNCTLVETKTIGEFSRCSQIKILHSTLPVPCDWKICNGIILPNNYVNVDEVERIFGSTNSFRYHMSRSKDRDVLSRMAKAKGVSLDDIEMRKASKDLCNELYGMSSVRLLDAGQRLEIGRQLRRRYLCSLEQLARIVHVPVVELKRYVG